MVDDARILHYDAFKLGHNCVKLWRQSVLLRTIFRGAVFVVSVVVFVGADAVAAAVAAAFVDADNNDNNGCCCLRCHCCW